VRAYAVVAAIFLYVGSRASVVVAHGVIATDGSPLVDTATQGGIVAVCIGLVYFFLQRGDRLAKASKDATVADLEMQIAEARGRLAGEVQRASVAETAERAMRADWMKVNADLVQAQAQQIAALHDLETLRRERAQLLNLSQQKDKP